MDEWYLRSLAALKDTFLGGNESQVLAEAILEHHRNQHMTLLDIYTIHTAVSICDHENIGDRRDISKAYPLQSEQRD
jgi:hypothetical protein